MAMHDGGIGMATIIRRSHALLAWPRHAASHRDTQRAPTAVAKNKPAGRGHPAARPHPRRRDPRAGGRDAFELVERVRQLSVAYRLKRDASAGRALDRLLKNLSSDQTVSVIRAFSYFSHLANIAEDRHHVRRRAHHERQGDLQDGSLAACFERLAAGARARRRDRRDAAARAHLAGAHRAPDRGAAQEHPRRRARDRRADRAARRA